MTAPVILWFRRDLRLSDHPALTAAVRAGPVIPVFVLDEATLRPLGGAARWWLHHALQSLARDLPLVLRRGRAATVLERLAAETGARAIYFSRGYEPGEIRQERETKAWADGRGVSLRRHGGGLLQEPEAVATGQGTPFKVFTPFARALRGLPPRAPKARAEVTLAGNLPGGNSLTDWRLLPTRPDWATGFAGLWQPGEAGARARLAEFLADDVAAYAAARDMPARPATSRLSPHLHWGEISPAQAWTASHSAMAQAGGMKDHGGEKFLSELIWRDFCAHLLFHFPHITDQPFRTEFADFPWTDDPAILARWQRGETGYPMVDAGMRELWTTGTMHNRVRMIVASFLIKHLLQHWRAGEAWFWDTLVDADLASNVANWQWVAGSGADAAPFFRIFNPVLQGEKFDPQGHYVRRWLPVLAALPDKSVHAPWTLPESARPKNYPPPLVDHAGARARALLAYQSLGT
jgi:deoxyribodipyrimidine photo-lyase